MSFLYYKVPVNFGAFGHSLDLFLGGPPSPSTAPARLLDSVWVNSSSERGLWLLALLSSWWVMMCHFYLLTATHWTPLCTWLCSWQVRRVFRLWWSSKKAMFSSTSQSAISHTSFLQVSLEIDRGQHFYSFSEFISAETQNQRKKMFLTLGSIMIAVPLFLLFLRYFYF